MARTIEIRPLGRDDDRSGFSCGQPEIDRYFIHYAGQNQFKLRLAVTYVALVDAQILGFAPVHGVREGLMHGEPLPMFLSVDTAAAARGV